jgi:hypothetical protein
MRAGLLFILMLMSSVFSSACIACDELKDAPNANILLTMDTNNTELGIVTYYENLSVSPSRQPISDYIILVHLTNTTGLDEVYRVYTDSEGMATFNFGAWSDGCINFEAIYCPFCDPASPTCGFEACLNYSNIDTTATSVEDIPLAPGASALGTLNPNKYVPGRKTANYCPPPAPLSNTPALCLPLLIIFAILSGSMYLTGRNPFAGFNIGGARVGRHIRYQARGRGFSFSVMAALSAALSVGQTIKTAVKAEKGKGGAAVLKSEKQAASQRFIGAGIGTASRGISKFKGALAATRNLSGKARARAMTRHLEATRDVLSGGESASDRGQSGTMTSSGMAFLPGGGGVRGSELISMDSSGRIGIGGTLLRMLGVVFTQTTIGRITDGFSYLASDESLLAHMGIVSHELRTQNDMEALRNVLSSDEGEEGIRVIIGDTVYLVRGVQQNEAGESVITLRVPEQTASPGQVARTGNQIQVTVNSEGTIVAMTYSLAGQAPVTPTNPQGLASVTVRADPEHEGMNIATVSFTGADGQPVERTISEFNTDRTAWGNVAGPAFEQLPGGIALGGNGSQLLDGFNTMRAQAGMIVSDASRENSIAMANIGNDIASELGSSPEARTRVREQRREMAAQELALAMGAPTDTFNTDGPVPGGGEDGQGLPASHYTRGLKADSDSMGEVSRVEVAVRTVHEVHSGSELSFTPDGEGTSPGQRLSSRVVEGSGLGDADQRTLSGVLPGILRSSSASELASMDRESFRAAAETQLLARAVTPEQREQVAAQAERLANAMPVSAFQPIQQAASSYISSLGQAGLNESMVERLSQADMSQIQRLSDTGAMMNDRPETLARVVAQDLNHYSYPQEMRGQAMEYRAMQDMSSSLAGMRQNLDAGNIMTASMQMQQFTEMNNVFLQTRAVNVAAGDDTLPQDRDPQTGRTVLESAQVASELLYQSARLGRSVEPTSDAAVQQQVALEQHSRELLTSAISEGHYDQAATVAQERYAYYSELGDSVAADRYMQVYQSIQAERPESERATAVQATVSQLPAPENLGHSSASIISEARREESFRTSVTEAAASGDWSTAMATAADRYRYHHEMGNEDMAGRYELAIQQISIMRHNDTAARESARQEHREYSGLGMGAMTAGLYEINTQLLGQVGEEERAPPSGLDVASGYLHRRWQQMGRGYENLIEVHERIEDVSSADDTERKRSPFRVKRERDDV